MLTVSSCNFIVVDPLKFWKWPFSLKNTGRNIMWYVTKVRKETASGLISAKSLKALKYNGQYIMIASRYINTDALVPLKVSWSSILYTSFILICMIFCRRGLGQEKKKWGRYQIIIFSRHLALCFMSSFYCKNLLLWTTFQPWYCRIPKVGWSYVWNGNIEVGKGMLVTNICLWHLKLVTNIFCLQHC